jgi:hypothetical protein
VPILAGGVVAWLVERRFGIKASDPDKEKIHQRGMLFAAGLITGEALMGIGIAVPIVLSERSDVLALPASMQFGQLVGLALLVVVGVLLYRSAVKRN